MACDMETFKSKKDWWVTAIFFGLCAIMLCTSVSELHNVVLWAITIATITLLLDMYFNTDYTIGNGLLIVRCGFFIRSKYEIKDIKKVERTRCLISSPALSADRLSLKIGKYDELIISPADRKDFIATLLRVNPNIEVGNMD